MFVCNSVLCHCTLLESLHCTPVGSKPGSYMLNMAVPDLNKFEGWQLYVCVEQYLCTHPKLDNMMYCLLELFKD